jgi:hypothetical protein
MFGRCLLWVLCENRQGQRWKMPKPTLNEQSVLTELFLQRKLALEKRSWFSITFASHSSQMLCSFCCGFLSRIFEWKTLRIVLTFTLQNAAEWKSHLQLWFGKIVSRQCIEFFLSQLLFVCHYSFPHFNLFTPTNKPRVLPSIPSIFRTMASLWWLQVMTKPFTFTMHWRERTCVYTCVCLVQQVQFEI